MFDSYLIKNLNFDFDSSNLNNDINQDNNNIYTVNELYDSQDDNHQIFNGNITNLFYEEKSTEWKTFLVNNKYNYNFSIFDELEKFFKEHKKLSEFSENLIKNKKIKDIENKLMKNKKKGDIGNKNNEKNEILVNLKRKYESKEKIKRGRKIKLENPYRIEHNKFSEDNIIRKIKVKIFAYPLIFINNILKRNKKNKYKLYKINYKYINQVKKVKDLEYLDMSLKDLYSFDISSKYKKFGKTHNKNIIIKIIEKKILIEDYSTIIFVFNLSLRKWLELFTYKKTINEIIKESEGGKDINLEIINKSFIGVEELLKKILEDNNKDNGEDNGKDNGEDNGEDYFSKFVFLLYNYEKWFDIKSGRKSNIEP